METWLITGGAGYIGAHVAEEVVRNGNKAVIVDDLSTGLFSRLSPNVDFEQASLCNPDELEKIFRKFHFDGVLHFAAKKSVPESIQNPKFYWDENMGGLINLLNAMNKFQIGKLVFSSSAAVYGEPANSGFELITEITSCTPINPYGATKLVGEWYCQARSICDGLNVIALRYFNVAGAGRPELGDVFAFNLVPLIFEAIDNGKHPRIFGDDYPTADGTCIRDYIHVQDLAEAHVAAMGILDAQDARFQAINIGTGKGSSVREVMEMVQSVTGLVLHPDIVARRVGDPAQLVASVDKARGTLGWTSKYDLCDIVSSAWDAWQYAKK